MLIPKQLDGRFDRFVDIEGLFGRGRLEVVLKIVDRLGHVMNLVHAEVDRIVDILFGRLRVVEHFGKILDDEGDQVERLTPLVGDGCDHLSHRRHFGLLDEQVLLFALGRDCLGDLFRHVFVDIAQLRFEEFLVGDVVHIEHPGKAAFIGNGFGKTPDPLEFSLFGDDFKVMVKACRIGTR